MRQLVGLPCGAVGDERARVRRPRGRRPVPEALLSVRHLVNANGKRFVDEGADFRNYTYAKYGRVVLEQPGQFAWQIFDQKVKHLQRDEYKIRQITKVTWPTPSKISRTSSRA